MDTIKYILTVIAFFLLLIVILIGTGAIWGEIVIEEIIRFLGIMFIFSISLCLAGWVIGDFEEM